MISGFSRQNWKPGSSVRLQTVSVFELGVTEKLKILMAMMNQMLTFAGVRDELDTRIESFFEAKAELRQTQTDENKDKKEVNVAGKTTRLQEKAIVAKEKVEQDR